MTTQKKIIFMLILLALPLIHGCSHDNTTSKISATKPPSSMTNTIVVSNQDRERMKNISKTEAEIYSELKKINGVFYRSTLGGATTDDMIADYNKVNLLSVKIISNIYDEEIKLSYDESLLKARVLDDFLEPVYSTAYNIATNNKIHNPRVEIYVNNRPLEEILKEQDAQSSSKKEISKIETEIFSELKKIDATTYRALFGEATTDDEIAEYTKIKLLWVKIISDTHGSKIRLSFDEKLLEQGECENFLDPIHHSVDYIAEKHKLFNPEVEIYVKDRSLYNDIWKENIKAWKDKNRMKTK